MPETATLLVVDDEPELCEILAEYFGGQGFVVQTAGSAAEARDVFDSQVPKVAILDIRMPGEDGLSLARWIREQHKGVGIIMLTTAADVVDRVVGLEMGADDYVPKPFDRHGQQQGTYRHGDRTGRCQGAGAVTGFHPASGQILLTYRLSAVPQPVGHSRNSLRKQGRGALSGTADPRRSHIPLSGGRQ